MSKPFKIKMILDNSWTFNGVTRTARVIHVYVGLPALLRIEQRFVEADDELHNDVTDGNGKGFVHESQGVPVWQVSGYHDPVVIARYAQQINQMWAEDRLKEGESYANS